MLALYSDIYFHLSFVFTNYFTLALINHEKNKINKIQHICRHCVEDGQFQTSVFFSGIHSPVPPPPERYPQWAQGVPAQPPGGVGDSAQTQWQGLVETSC